MPLYNVDLTLTCTLVVVVQADDEDHAYDVALCSWRDGIRDPDARPTVIVTGEVTKESHLRGGWDGHCIPYGGDGNTRLRVLLTPDA